MAEAFAADAAPEGAIAVAASDPVGWRERAYDREAAPSLVPDVSPEARPVPAGDNAEIDNKPARRLLPPRPLPRKPSRKNAAAAAFVMAAILLVTAAISGRATIVHAVPDLAGLYAAAGLPVNLRGLEFHGVRTTSEMQDGIAVLVIEGEVANITKHAVEVPRVRLAVIGGGGQELYSWTTLLPRSTLSEDEKVSFRSRLASPPPDGREVLVRFLTRNDLTSGH